MRPTGFVSAAVLAGSLLAAIEAFAQPSQPPPAPPASTTAASPAAPAPSTTATTTPPAAQPPAAQPPAAMPPAPAAPPAYPPGYGAQGYPPGYGQQATPPGYGQPQYPPGYGPQTYPPGYGPPVYGQPAYGPPYSGYGGYAGPIAPPPPAAETGVHLHDGFYLRMAFGIGHLSSTLTPDGGSGEIKTSGAGMGIDFAMGGAIIPGFILGGRLLGINAYNPSYKNADGTTSDNTELMLSTIQVAADIYPMPDKGLHFMAGVGPATLSFKQKYSSSGLSGYPDESTSADGISFSAGAGWETWVGEQWSVGGMVGFTWAWMRDSMSADANRIASEDKEADMKVFSPSVMFTATYN